MPTLYLVSALCLAAAAWPHAVRRFSRDRKASGAIRDIEGLCLAQIAVLRGGARAVLHPAVALLYRRGIVDVDQSGRIRRVGELTPDQRRHLDAAAELVYDLTEEPIGARGLARSGLPMGQEALRALQAAGLCRTQVSSERMRQRMFVPAGLALGVALILILLQELTPAVTLVALAALVGALAAIKLRRTANGRAALRALRARRGRIAPTSLKQPEEWAEQVALRGFIGLPSPAGRHLQRSFLGLNIAGKSEIIIFGGGGGDGH